MIEYMTLHNIPLVDILLPLTIVLQIALGIMLIIGYKIKRNSNNSCRHDYAYKLWHARFWNEYSNMNVGHEMQNFFKNLGIFAGLLVLSASAKVNQWRLLKET